MIDTVMLQYNDDNIPYQYHFYPGLYIILILFSIIGDFDSEIKVNYNYLL